jgi:hypothetical protein
VLVDEGLILGRLLGQVGASGAKRPRIVEDARLRPVLGLAIVRSLHTPRVLHPRVEKAGPCVQVLRRLATQGLLTRLLLQLEEAVDRERETVEYF